MYELQRVLKEYVKEVKIAIKKLEYMPLFKDGTQLLNMMVTMFRNSSVNL